MKDSIHIQPSQGRWKVRKYGSYRAMRSFREKEDAIKFAKSLAGDRAIYVHGEDGLVETKYELRTI